MRAPIRVLVADDNEDHVFLIVRALRSEHGMVLEIETAGDGEEVLDHLYSRGRFEDRPKPNLVLLDLKMPKVSGLEVLEQVKADPALRSIPIVVLSSSERPEDVASTYRLGGNSYVSKPANLDGLRAGVRGISQYWTELAALPEGTP